MAERESKPAAVEKGQVYIDKDTRYEGRQIIVDFVEGNIAHCEPYQNKGRTTYISVHRLLGRGYEYVDTKYEVED